MVVGTGAEFRHRIGGTAATDDRPHELCEPDDVDRTGAQMGRRIGGDRDGALEGGFRGTQAGGRCVTRRRRNGRATDSEAGDEAMAEAYRYQREGELLDRAVTCARKRPGKAALRKFWWAGTGLETPTDGCSGLDPRDGVKRVKPGRVPVGPARPPVPGALDHAALTSIILGIAACGAGTLTWSMPFAYFASTWAASTPSGSAKFRWNAPYATSRTK